MSIFHKAVKQFFHKELRQSFLVSKKKDTLSKKYDLIQNIHWSLFDLTKSSLLKDR